MGNDGGSIAKRRDLTKQKKVKGKISCLAIQKAKARLCALTQEPLISPIFTCKLGFLYNKSGIFSALNSNTLPSSFSHISTSKDIIEAKFHNDSLSLSCPVSGIEYNGVNKFQVMWDCGCVLSEKALKEIPSENCLMCSSVIRFKVPLGQSKEQQKISQKELGIKRIAKKSTEGETVKRVKLVDQDVLEKVHLGNMESEVYQSLFSKENSDETYCCRNLRAGLR